MPNYPRQLLQTLGPLRATLSLGALAMLLLRPAPHTAPVYGGWVMAPTVLAPVLTPLVFMTLLLDALMGVVLFVSSGADGRRRYRAVIAIDLVLAGLLAVWWWPYYAALGR